MKKRNYYFLVMQHQVRDGNSYIELVGCGQSAFLFKLSPSRTLLHVTIPSDMIRLAKTLFV